MGKLKLNPRKTKTRNGETRNVYQKLKMGTPKLEILVKTKSRARKTKTRNEEN